MTNLSSFRDRGLQLNFSGIRAVYALFAITFMATLINLINQSWQDYYKNAPAICLCYGKKDKFISGLVEQ